MPEKSVFTIELPVQPKDVFRLLALRSVTETSDLIKKLLENFDQIFNGIETTPRLDRDVFGRDAFRYEHTGLDVKKTGYEDMTERQLCAAKTAFYADKDFDGIGRVLDYEMPLDDKKDSAFGKVDLVSQVNDELLLLEVKKWESNEPPLRAMFEIFTFWKTLFDKSEGFSKFLNTYVESPTYRQRKADLRPPKKVAPGLLLREGSDIFNKLFSTPKTDDTKYEYYKLCEDLYKCFLQPPIGMRIFKYKVLNSALEVEEMTCEIKNRLGLD